MDFDTARHNMLEQQIRTWEVFDQDVLEAIETIPRENFVPEKYKTLALADVRIPLAHGQLTMMPKMEARMLQSVQIKPADRVLEIGTGCAYVTALLGKLASEVVSLDIYAEFTDEAVKKCREAGLNNIELVNADGLNGYSDKAPYDVIVITGSLPDSVEAFKAQLACNGRMFAIIGQSPVMEATLITRYESGHYSEVSLFETDLPALIGAESMPEFHL